jgi:hypothetical protein
VRIGVRGGEMGDTTRTHRCGRPAAVAMPIVCERGPRGSNGIRFASIRRDPAKIQPIACSLLARRESPPRCPPVIAPVS